MTVHAAYELIRHETVVEIASEARLFRHKRTGAEVMSFTNADENKAFNIVFKTLPTDASGVAHILEHSVLCGSKKYRVKKPFVELAKSSLQSFLNAMTFADKTAYPVASQNLADFYNLIDVYLDAVLFPLLSEDTFRQEGWHHEAEGAQMPLAFKGVVFNEMKGAYASPAQLLGKLSQTSLFPDTVYGVNSGGDPKAIPDLTYQAFLDFHRRYYHPSNARIVFYGDDPEPSRLEMLDAYLSRFELIPTDAAIARQPRWTAPRQITQGYATSPGDAGGKAGLVSVNWLLGGGDGPDAVLALQALETVLLGSTAAPLFKAMIDSGFGEGLTGSGIVTDLLEPYFTVGLKGIDPNDAEKIEDFILVALRDLAAKGIAEADIASTMNSLEFALREDNTGAFPRGLAVGFRALRSWIHGGDPFAPLAFEGPLKRLKDRLAAGEPVFETLIANLLLDNPHRTRVLLVPDPELAAAEARAERARLDAHAATLDDAARAALVNETTRLVALQGEPDPPEALAGIPALHLADLDRRGKTTPTHHDSVLGAKTLFHDLPTSGVVYVDLAFDLGHLPPELLPYLSLFGRALFETGAGQDDFVALTQRIGRLTGGLGATRMLSMHRDRQTVAGHFLIRGKAVADRADDLFAILSDVLARARFDNRTRIRQMVLEAKAAFESGLAARALGVVHCRLGAMISPAGWASEQVGGISHLFFLRELAAAIDTDDGWLKAEAALFALRDLLVDRQSMVVNVTAEARLWPLLHPTLERFVEAVPKVGALKHKWPRAPRASEGLTFPAQVNYVAKGADLYAHGYTHSGATMAALQYLNTGYLWDRVRVAGGAYGASAGFDPYSGAFIFSSYRDPNLVDTLAVYDEAARFLETGIGAQDLTRSIIGAIGTIDAYRLPDAKGYVALMWELAGTTAELRQQRREELLSASAADFRRLGGTLAEIARAGDVAVLGSEAAIAAANATHGDFLQVIKVL